MPLHQRAWQVIAGAASRELSDDRFLYALVMPSRDILKMLSEEQELRLTIPQWRR